MAKDGTQRGGARVGAGRKPKSLKDKILDGTEEFTKSESGNISGIPELGAYLRAKQKSGGALEAEKVAAITWEMLNRMNVSEFVNPYLVEQYAMSVARWIQIEKLISRNGFVGEHPTTGAEIPSAYVKMELNYMKQINQNWLLIMSVIKENFSGDISAIEADPMEQLMKRREKLHLAKVE